MLRTPSLPQKATCFWLTTVWDVWVLDRYRALVWKTVTLFFDMSRVRYFQIHIRSLQDEVRNPMMIHLTEWNISRPSTFYRSYFISDSWFHPSISMYIFLFHTRFSSLMKCSLYVHSFWWLGWQFTTRSELGAWLGTNTFFMRIMTSSIFYIQLLSSKLSHYTLWTNNVQSWTLRLVYYTFYG